MLLVAPHGGRRDPERHPWQAGGLRVNDLYTADLALELGERLDADVIANAALDRNDLDLNRLGQVRSRAPWFLEALAARLEALLERHRDVAVLFVHGWNVANPICDCGIGTPPPPHDGWAMPLEATGAVDETFLRQRLWRLREACRRRDIPLVCGWRYPASHPENLLQLFTGRYRGHPDPLLDRLARLGCGTNAAQLELSVPLRWPGPWRERFLDACADTLGSPAQLAPAGSRPDASDDGRREAPGDCLDAPLAVQFHDDATGLAGIAALGVAAGGRLGRLLVVPPDGGLYLFTGELPAPTAAGPGYAPHATLEPGGILSLEYHGPLLRFPDTTPFLDLESGLARATVVEAALVLRVNPVAHGGASWHGFGRARGTLRLAVPGCARDGRAPGAVQSTAIVGPTFMDDQPRLRTGNVLVATLCGGPLGPLRIVVPAGGITAASCQPVGPRDGLTVERLDLGKRPGDPGDVLARITLCHPGRPAVEVLCQARRRVPVVRQLRGGRVREHILAFCGFRVGGRPAGLGWVEARL